MAALKVAGASTENGTASRATQSSTVLYAGVGRGMGWRSAGWPEDGCRVHNTCILVDDHRVGRDTADKSEFHCRTHAPAMPMLRPLIQDILALLTPVGVGLLAFWGG